MSGNDWFKQYKALEDKREAVSNDYYKLRDAKSDGFCWGLNPIEVENYDKAIMLKADELEDIDKKLARLLAEVN